MKDEPDIVRQLKEAEKLDVFQRQMVSMLWHIEEMNLSKMTGI